jgi:hypothetical protein
MDENINEMAGKTKYKQCFWTAWHELSREQIDLAVTYLGYRSENIPQKLQSMCKLLNTSDVPILTIKFCQVSESYNINHDNSSNNNNSSDNINGNIPADNDNAAYQTNLDMIKSKYETRDNLEKTLYLPNINGNKTNEDCSENNTTFDCKNSKCVTFVKGENIIVVPLNLNVDEIYQQLLTCIESI